MPNVPPFPSSKSTSDEAVVVTVLDPMMFPLQAELIREEIFPFLPRRDGIGFRRSVVLATDDSSPVLENMFAPWVNKSLFIHVH